jgi:hypothetical protein
LSALAGIAVLLLIVAAVVLAVLLVAAGVLSHKRESRHGTSGSLSSAMMEVDSLFDPSKRHTIESTRHESGEADESGDPPD